MYPELYTILVTSGKNRKDALANHPPREVEIVRGSGLFGWLSALGPGLVYVLTVLGAGDIVSNSTAGAGYGYSLIWALGMTSIFRFVWVNTSAKYVLVTGETLLSGYGRIGNWVVWVVLISLIFIRHFYNLYLVLMVGSSAHYLIPLPTEHSAAISTVLFTLVGFAMMFWGGYSLIESFCKVLIAFMGASLITAAFMSNPDPAGILRGTLLPSLPQAEGMYSAILIILALIGTEAGSTTNLSYAYFIREKGWNNISFLKRQRFDLAVGVICMFLMGAMLQIAAAGIIHPLGIDVQDTEDMGRIFSESQGWVGWLVFGLGLWGASFTTLIGANTGAALIVTDICRTFVGRFKVQGPRDKSAVKRDPIYRWVVAFWSLSPLYIVFTGIRPVWLVLTVSSLVVVLIPVLAISLLKITNDKDLMGSYRNGWLTNTVLIILIGISVYFTYHNAADLMGKL